MLDNCEQRSKETWILLFFIKKGHTYAFHIGPLDQGRQTWDIPLVCTYCSTSGYLLDLFLMMKKVAQCRETLGSTGGSLDIVVVRRT